ncbi:MAG TPA: GTPase [Streptosporangiaceae bacterium]|jgi:GTP-binding protein EngB required for normal cell division
MTSGAPPWPGLPAASRPRRGVAALVPAAGTAGTGLAGSEFAEPELTGTGAGLSGRLTALARLIQIGAARGGSDGFGRQLLEDAEDLLARAGERLRLSASHTVVALAGGTGSGKSSLFNRLAGADFSTVGVTRPITRDAHACVWGVAGSGPLLEWLGVPRRYRYARGSALDRGEQAMAGLVLLDLPDHDSVVAGASDQVDRLIGLADLMVWVLDPQKYADAAVHRRFLVPLAGHSDVVAVVLNQCDLLTGGQVEDCITDLRRLLDSEGLTEVPILATSADTGTGIGELRTMLVDAVRQRRAASARISADLDQVAARFAEFIDPVTARGSGQAGPDGLDGLDPGSGDDSADGAEAAADAAADAASSPAPGGGTDGAGVIFVDDPFPGDPDYGVDKSGGAAGQDGQAARPGADAGPAAQIPDGSTAQLVEAFSGAAGVTAVSDSLQAARELRAVDYVGWPIGWLAERVTGRNPVRKMRLGKLWDEVRTVSAGPSGAQQAEIDNALTRLADEIGPALPRPWSRTVRAAVRSRAGEIPPALGAAMGEALPAEDKIAPWWRLVGALQGLLLGAVIVGVAWIAAIVVFGVFGAADNVPRLFGDVGLIPWICVMLAAFLLLGWLTASGCMNLVRTAALTEREDIGAEIRARMAVVAREMVIVPAEQELSEYQRFGEELRSATGQS